MLSVPRNRFFIGYMNLDVFHDGIVESGDSQVISAFCGGIPRCDRHCICQGPRFSRARSREICTKIMVISRLNLHFDVQPIS
jgi:hypothetical protein